MKTKVVGVIILITMPTGKQEAKVIVYQSNRGRGPICWTEAPTPQQARKTIQRLKKANAIILKMSASRKEAERLAAKSPRSADLSVATPCDLGHYPTDLRPPRHLSRRSKPTLNRVR